MKWLFALLILIITPWRAQAQSLEAMEVITAKAHNLSEFLSNKNLVEAYYKAAAAYYGSEKFPRKSFDAILEQMKSVSGKVPDFAERLWETSDLGKPFEVVTEGKSYGRKIDSDAWHNYLSDWLREITHRPGPAAMTKGELRALKVSTDEFEQKLVAENLPRKARERKALEFYKKIKSDPAFRAAIDAILIKYLRSYKESLSGREADDALNAIDELRLDPRKIIEQYGITGEPASILISELRIQIPTVKTLLEREDVFPKIMVRTRNGQAALGATGPTTYDFVPIPRRFHGVFEGVALGECVGGGEGHTLDLTPERWAVIALQGSQRYHVEKYGNYLGFIGMTPIKRNETPSDRSEVFASVDLGAPVLKQNVVMKDKFTGQNKTVPLLEAWFPRQVDVKPKAWSGFVLGSDDAISNAGVLSTARALPAYKMGRFAGSTQHFEHIDPMAEQIVKASPELTGVGQGYTGRMIFDAFQGSDNDLTKLVRIDLGGLKNRAKVESLLSGATNNSLIRIIPKLDDKLIADPGFQSLLIDSYLRRSPDPMLARNLAQRLNSSASDVVWNDLTQRLIDLIDSPDRSAQALTLLEQLASWQDRVRIYLASSPKIIQIVRNHLEGKDFRDSEGAPISLLTLVDPTHIAEDLNAALSSDSSVRRERALDFFSHIGIDGRKAILSRNLIKGDHLIDAALSPEGRQRTRMMSILLSYTLKLSQDSIKKLVALVNDPDADKALADTQYLNQILRGNLPEEVWLAEINSPRVEIAQCAFASRDHPESEAAFEAVLKLLNKKGFTQLAQKWFEIQYKYANWQNGTVEPFLKHYTEMPNEIQFEILKTIRSLLPEDAPTIPLLHRLANGDNPVLRTAAERALEHATACGQFRALAAKTILK